MMTALLFLGVWILASFPFGVLLGKFISGPPNLTAPGAPRPDVAVTPAGTAARSVGGHFTT